MLAHTTFPKKYRANLHPTKPIKRLDGEIKLRTEVVGICTNEDAISGSLVRPCSNKTTNGLSSSSDTCLGHNCLPA